MQGFTAQQQDEIRQIIREELQAIHTIQVTKEDRRIKGSDLIVAFDHARNRNPKQ